MERDEAGLTLTETMMALGVMFVTLFSLAYTATISYYDTALARQRQSATGLADQAIEQIRALPFDTVKKGLSSNDPTVATDPDITLCGVNKCYGGERIPLTGYAAGTVIKPLVSHQTTSRVGPTTYTVLVYVTYCTAAPTCSTQTSNTFRITTVVTWSAAERRGTSHRVQLQTILYSPSGCLSTATHPFAAPCQPFLYGNAASGQQSIDITGSIQSLSFGQADLWVPAEASDSQVEQIATVQGTSFTSGASIDDDSVGQATGSSGADNDPGTPGQLYNAQNVTGPAASTVSVSGGQNALSLTSSGADGAASVTTAAAAVAQSPSCTSPSGLAQTDGLPCGSSTSFQGGTLSATVTLNSTGSNLGTATLASLAAPVSPSTPNRAFTDLTQSTGTDGMIHAEASRTLGTLTLAGLPSGVPSGSVPTGWAGYLVRVTGFHDSVSAEAGVNSVAPTLSASGTVTYWNGSGYSTLTIAPGSPANISVPAVHIAYTDTSGPIAIDISASVTTGGTSTNDPAGCTNPCTRTQSSAASASPIVGSITYAVTSGGAQICNLVVKVDLGTLAAKGTYSAAPQST
ncbi:MAG: hypothetical protein M3Q23_10290 [Actinomycetota bacterium]|nr:hypothetical protein [Actinomycetota bacterium]